MDGAVAAPPLPDPGSSAQEAVQVCTEAHLRKEGRWSGQVHGRDVVVFHHQGGSYCMDRICHHAGGPLQDGDIEDIAGHACIVCPWHKIKITLATGESLYRAIDPATIKQRPPRTRWTSKGVKQRMHTAEIRDGNVYVTLSNNEQKVDSDYYYSEEYKKLVSSSKRGTT
ncbi:Rieske domain-containing protein-like [Branchiostoma floridae x Branchiostoma japonicum]